MFKTEIANKIYNAVKKSCPISVNGTTIVPPELKFDVSNPYILEALADEKTAQYLRYNGENLMRVCKLLDKTKICKGFSKPELKDLYKKAFPDYKVPSGVNCDAMVYLNSLPDEIGKQYDAHGLSKSSIPDQLEQLNELLTNGIDKTGKFYTAPLAVPVEEAAGAGTGLGTSGGCAVRDASFIITGDKSKSLKDDGIKHVIVNDAYYSIIADLREKFPDIGFVRADRAVEYFSKL